MEYKIQNNSSISPVELIIARTLNKHRIKFKMEVIFEGCINDLTGKPLRYDFYLPDQNILLEYDGKDYHKEADVKLRDAIKTKFAIENKFNFHRIEGINNLEAFFSNVLNVFDVEKLPRKEKVIRNKEDAQIDDIFHYIFNDQEKAFDILYGLRLSGDRKIYNLVKKTFPLLMEYPKIKQMAKYKIEIISRLKTEYDWNVGKLFGRKTSETEKAENDTADLLENYGNYLASLNK